MKRRSIKNLVAVAMAIMVVTVAAPFNSVANADTVPATFDLIKAYKLINDGANNPAETFTFNIEKVGTEDSSKTLETMPSFASGSYDVSFGEGTATSAGKENTNNITLPDFDSVGIYKYRITEASGSTAGVNYFNKAVILKVYVTNSETVPGTLDKTCVLVLDDGTNNKVTKFENTYSAGKLNVTKKVTGLFGDTKKEFTVNVTFKAPDGKTVKSTINYTDDTVMKSITPDQMADGTETVAITLKDKETVTFDNIPYGVTYTVSEEDYSGDRYAQSVEYGDDTKTVNSEADDVTVVNSKGGTVATGIIYNTTMYGTAALLIVVLSVIVLKRRKDNQEK